MRAVLKPIQVVSAVLSLLNACGIFMKFMKFKWQFLLGLSVGILSSQQRVIGRDGNGLWKETGPLAGVLGRYWICLLGWALRALHLDGKLQM